MTAEAAVRFNPVPPALSEMIIVRTARSFWKAVDHVLALRERHAAVQEVHRFACGVGNPALKPLAHLPVLREDEHLAARLVAAFKRFKKRRAFARVGRGRFGL